VTQEQPGKKAGIPRRTMLRRIGAGAAVAWTAPVLTSVKTPAFAGSPPSPCGDQICAACNVQQDCGGAPPRACNCWRTSEDNGGQCACLSFVMTCDETPPCPNGQADCDANAPGDACVETCCGNICAPKCAIGMVRPWSGSARTTR
jgi:hypothetical protein